MQTHLYLKRTKIISIWLICLLLIAGSVFMALLYFSDAAGSTRRSGMLIVIAPLLFLACSAGVIVSFKKFSYGLRHKPILTFDQRGITDHGTTLSSAPDLMAWTDMVAVGLGTLNSNSGGRAEQLLIIELRDGKIVDRQLPTWKVGLLNMSRRMGFTDNTVFVSLAMIAATNDQILDVIKSYAPAALTTAPVDDASVLSR